MSVPPSLSKRPTGQGKYRAFRALMGDICPIYRPNRFESDENPLGRPRISEESRRCCASGKAAVRRHGAVYEDDFQHGRMIFHQIGENHLLRCRRAFGPSSRPGHGRGAWSATGGPTSIKVPRGISTCPRGGMSGRSSTSSIAGSRSSIGTGAASRRGHGPIHAPSSR